MQKVSTKVGRLREYNDGRREMTRGLVALFFVCFFHKFLNIKTRYKYACHVYLSIMGSLDIMLEILALIFPLSLLEVLEGLFLKPFSIILPYYLNTLMNIVFAISRRLI